MAGIRWLDTRVAAMAQLGPDDMLPLAEAGITGVVNHRPDGEEAGQPRDRELAAAATAAGLSYTHIPVSGAPGAGAIASTAAVMDKTPDGRFVFFCRSGMRSAAAWAGARRLQGVDAEELRASAAAAGYDLSRLPL